MSTIVVHPRADVVHAADILDRRPGLDAVEPGIEGVVEALSAAEGPRAFVCANKDWESRFLDPLDPGDWVAAVGVGYDAFPLEAFEDRGVAFTNAAGVSNDPTAEHAMGLAVSFSRRLLDYRDQQREGEWNRLVTEVTDYAGEVCCVVGIGNVGEAVAERARAFGMTVRGVKRSVEGYDGAAHEVYPAADLHAALADARLAVVCVPLTGGTRGLIGEAELAALDDDAVLVNVARGPVVDTDALLAALDSGGLAGAGLDVFDEEPLPPDSPLWDRDDVFVTPHTAGLTEKYTPRLLDILLDQHDAWRAGEAMPNRIV